MDIGELVKSGKHFICEPISVPDGTVLKAEKGCRIIGGKELTPVMTENGIWVCDLDEAGIEPSPFVSRGFGRPISPSHNELFLNGRPMFLSQFPKRGQFLTIEKAGKALGTEGDRSTGLLKDGFYYRSDEPKKWRKDQNINLFGYWHWDWAPTREQPESIDAENNFISFSSTVKGQTSLYEGQRFFFYNIIEEVTEPGDYCIDFAHRKLYFRPFEDVDMTTAEVLLSTEEQPAFCLENAKNIVLDGFCIEAFLGMGIRIRNCENIILRNCEISGIGNRAVCVDASRDVLVTHCHIHDTGDGGVSYYCGDRKTLEPGNCSVEYCHFHDISNWDRCYEPPIRLYGVGLSARFNRIHDCPHSAVLFGGNEISVTDNDIFRCVLETGDAGAIYGGRDYTNRGNEMSRNFIHDIGSGYGYGAIGIYNDDMISGTKMENNIFYRVQQAIELGGGVDLKVWGNIFIDCPACLLLDSRGQNNEDSWRSMMDGQLRNNFYNIANAGISGVDEPYRSRYPELKEIDDAFKAEPIPHIAPSFDLKHNIYCPDRNHHYWDLDPEQVEEKDSLILTKEELKDYLTPYQQSVIFGKCP